MKTVPLNTKIHNRKLFDCGVDALNNYLQLMANQQDKRDNTRTFVLEDTNNKQLIIGYYTLTIVHIELATLPKKLQNRHKNNSNAALIARLAVDKKYQKQGFGEMLLVDALIRLIEANKLIPFPIVVVDAKEDAVEFYRNYGFIKFYDEKNRLFITMDSVRKSFNYK